jgi:hypothetical protein
MRKKILGYAALFLLSASALHAEIAIIPYKIENSSVDFPESTGGEYSRLLSVASLLLKDDVDVASPREVDLDLERLKLSPQDVITKEDLDVMGKTLHIDYFLLGSLTHQGDRYRSDSVLYSVRDRRIIARARVADKDLFGLAEKEIKEALRPFRDKTGKGLNSAGSGSLDLVFLLDLSYRVNQDWASVKNAAAGLASYLIDSRRMDTRVYVVPFSDRAAYTSASVSVNSIPAVRDDLDKLKPAGGAGEDVFMKSLQYSISSIRWRSGAKKVIVLISNSNIHAGSADKYGVMARNKGIIINAVSLGQISGDQSEVPDRLTSITGGIHSFAAYHQKLFDPAGEAVEVYMENGRLFRSRFADQEWRKGLYSKEGPRRQHGKAKSFLDEIFISEKKAQPTPYALPQTYTRATMDRVINQEKLEDNIDLLVKRGMSKWTGRKTTGQAIAGKALISDGKVSFWVTASDDNIMDFFIEHQKKGFVFPLGVMVKKDAASAYGISLIPVIKGLGTDFLPQCLKAGLSDIVRRGDYYSTKGLSFPPVWFVEVKVENAEKSRGHRDIRGK